MTTNHSKSVEYYLPGSNANAFTIRKEVGRDPKGNPGHGEVTDIEVTAEKAFKAVNNHEALVEALKRVEPIIKYLNEASNCNPEYDEMLGPQIPDIEKQITSLLQSLEAV